MKASKLYKTKPVNVVNQEWHSDGSATVTIYKEGWKRAYKFKARRLYEANEEILEDEDVKEEGV